MKELKNKIELSRFFETLSTRIMNAELGITSSAIAYYALLSIFPLIIMLGNLLPYLKIDSETALEYIAMLIPSDVFSMIEGTVEQLLNTSYSGLLSLSAVATVWAASRSINALQRSLNKVYGVGGNQNLFFSRMISFLVIFMFMVVMLILTTVFTFGQEVMNKLAPTFPHFVENVREFSSLKLPTTIMGIFVTLFLIYSVLPNAKIKLRYIIPGTTIATAGWMGLTQVFGYYAKYFTLRFSSYGILGSLIIVLLWLNFAGTLIIVGGIINAVIQEYLDGDIKEKQLSLKKIKQKYWV